MTHACNPGCLRDWGGESVLSKTLTQTKVKSREATVPHRALARVCVRFWVLHLATKGKRQEEKMMNTEE